MKTKNRIWIYPLIVMGFLLMQAANSKKDEILPDYANKIANILNTGGTDKIEMVTICHKPCTPAQKTLVIPIQALAGHLGHGDVIGACSIYFAPTTGPGLRRVLEP
jgi:hypothetical protein